MEREIKFRGICIDKNTINSGMMVYGNLVIVEERYYIVEVLGEDSFIWNEVRKETAGQYTGLKDKNGVEIYEGDIIKHTYYKYSNDENGEKGFQATIHEVVFNKGSFRISNMPIGLTQTDDTEYIEVIGNIHENQELLEQEEGK